jgi:hypothetical protein
VRGRFPFATLAALVGAVLLAISGELLLAGIFLAMGLVLGAVTWRSAR